MKTFKHSSTMGIVLFFAILTQACGGSVKDISRDYPVTKITPGLKKAMSKYTHAHSGFHHGLAIVENGSEKQGLINLNGEEVVPCEYNTIHYEDGYYYVTKRFFNDYLHGLIDSLGRQVLPCEYARIAVYKEEQLIVPCKKTKSGYSFGLADLSGKLLTQLNLDYREFSKYYELVPFEGLLREQNAPFDPDWNWNGFIDTKGNDVLCGGFSHLSHFTGGMALAHKKSKLVGLIGRDGKIIYAAKEENGKVGLVDTEGNEVMPCKYDCIRGYDSGYLIVRDNKREVEGIFDLKQRKEVLPLSYKWIEESYAYDRKKGEKHIFSPNGYITDDQMCMFYWDGYFIVQKGRKKGVADSNGNEILPCVYDQIDIYPKHQLIVTTNNLPFASKRQSAFSTSGTCIAEDAGGLSGISVWEGGFVSASFPEVGGALYDNTGKEIHFQKGGHIENVGEGIMGIWSLEKGNHFRTFGGKVFGNDFREIGAFAGGLAPIEKGGKCGFINRKGESTFD